MISSKINELVNYLNQHSQFYQQILTSYDLNSFSIEDLKTLPFTTKDDLAKYNEAFLCVPPLSIADIVTTSGTMSESVSFYLTSNDIERLAKNEEASFRLAGCTSDDIIQLMVTLDKQFMAGLAYYSGAQKMGATTIRLGPSSPQNQLSTLLKYRTTTIVAIPSFIVKLIDTANERGVDLNKSSVRNIICIGEPIRKTDFSLNELGRRILKHWSVQLYSTYASTEMSTAFTECKYGAGGHLNDEMLYLEVIDENGNGVEDGGLGEVVISTLGIEGMPLLRYRTGDLCHVHYKTCSCGLKTPRLGPVVGRKQQMIKFNGTTLFPPSIFAVLEEFNISLYKIEITKNEFGNDEVNVLLSSDFLVDHNLDLLKSGFRSKTRVTPNFKFVDKAVLKAMVFPEDKRKPEKIVFNPKL